MTEPRIPQAPKGLTPASRAEWRRVIRVLQSRGRGIDAHLGAVEQLCRALDQAAHARAAIDRDGYSVDGKRNPALAVLARQESLIARLQGELALTPQSERRLLGRRAGSESVPKNVTVTGTLHATNYSLV